jgi:hypothetical protein
MAHAKTYQIVELLPSTDDTTYHTKVKHRSFLVIFFKVLKSKVQVCEIANKVMETQKGK